MKYSKVLAALAFSAIISAESVALEPVRHTVFSTDITNLGTYTQVGAVVNIKVSIFESVNSANKVYEETHTVTVNNFGFLQFEIGSGTFVSGSYAGGLTPSLIVKTYVVDGETERIIDTKRMSEIIYNANVSRYSHTVGLNPDPALTGASVISQIQIDENGVLTTTNRDLTPADIGAASTTQLADGLALKVDKETGKSLMTDAERTKLTGIAEGAEVNVNADWNATTGDAQILNKPTTLAGYGITDAASATQLADGLALKVDKVAGMGLSANDFTNVLKTKLDGIQEGATNYQHPLTHPATMIVEDETHRFVTDTEKANWNAGTSLNRGYIFIGDAQNKPLATLGGEGEVLMSNGVYNNFGKVKDVNIASDAAISGRKITPDFGPNSEITGGELNVGQINVLAEAPYQGTIYTEGTITSDGGFDGTSLTVTGSVLAGDISSDGDVDVVGNVTAGGDLAATGDVSGVKGIFSGDVSGAKGTFTGDVSGVKGTFSGDVEAANAIVSGTIMAGDIAIAADAGTGTTGSLTADGTIEALGGFVGTLSGNATTATNLENATADNTVYLGNTAGNAWGKITNDHIDDNAAIAQSKVDGLTADLAAKANATDLTAHTANVANPHAVTKAQVGLGDVDNTSDLAKPISTATQNALNAKANAADLTAHTSNVANPHAVTKAQVGLEFAENTADLDKPVSTATQTALNLKANLAGAAFTGAISGTTATFTGAVKGIAPVANNDLTTKLYVDTEVANATLTAGQGIEINAKAISTKLHGTTLSKSNDGLKLNLANANTWTAAQTVEAKVTANEFSTATGRLVTGETLGTAWANVNKGANAVLEMGLGLAANGTDREGYGITINDDDANHRAVLGKTQFGWSAGVQGTTAAAGAVTSGAADAKLVVMNGLVEKFSADQDGLVKATTFQGALNGNANTATSASSASLLAPTEAAGNSAVTAINLSTGNRISGGRVNPDFTGQNIIGDALVIPVDGDIYVGSALDAFVVEGATGNVTAKGTVTAPTFNGALTGNVTGNVSGSASSFTGNLVGDVGGTQGATVIGANKVLSTMIKDGEIMDADINDAAAIAGTKIAPNFGAQNVVTTGTVTAPTFNGALTGNVTGNVSGSAASFTGNLVGDVGGTQGATVIGANKVLSTMIKDGEIMDADINDAAAIAGTKIAPNFGAQNVVTTGTVTATTFNGALTGNVTGNVSGSAASFTGNLVGDVGGTQGATVIGANKVLSTMINDGEIVNADINDAAAIAGTKIAPNFGAQNVVTTGTVTATTFNGALTGNVTGNVSGSAASFTGNLVGDVGGTQGATVIGANKVLSTMINDGEIVNADINDAAAIAGTKIAPNFGAQNVVTTGTVTATTFNGALTGNVTGNVTGDVSGKINKVTITDPGTAATITLADNSTLATAGNFSTVGADGLILTTTGATNVTLPTTGTLATLAGVETFTNKTLTSPKINENVALTATSTELNYTDVTAIGTVEASKAVVVDANKNISGFRSVGIDLGADAFTALTINTTAASAKAAELQGSVGITTALADATDPTLTVKSSGNSRGIEAITDGNGIAGYFQNAGSSNHLSPTLYAESNSDGTDGGGDAWGKAAAVYATNLTTTSTSTALYIESGRAILSYAEVAAAAATLDLSDLGYASVISISAGVNGANLTAITFPASAENGQVLYLVNNSGEAMTNVGLSTEHQIAAGQTATFIYAGGWSRVK